MIIFVDIGKIKISYLFFYLCINVPKKKEKNGKKSTKSAAAPILLVVGLVKELGIIGLGLLSAEEAGRRRIQMNDNFRRLNHE